MRLLGILIALCLAIGAILYSRNFSWVSSEFKGVFDSFWYQKVISVTGLKAIPEFEIIEKLPAERSVGWWNSNLDQIGADLQKDPRIKSATISRCSDRAMPLDCFEVKIQEREPSFVTEFGGNTWLVGDDGGFIRPVSTSDKFQLPKVIGMRGSLQLVRNVCNRVALAIADIDKIVGRRLDSLLIDENGELKTTFDGIPFVATFSFSGFDEITIADQARRLVALLEVKREQIATIKEVDLAFDKIAVVKYRDTPDLKDKVAAKPTIKAGSKLKKR